MEYATLIAKLLSAHLIGRIVISALMSVHLKYKAMEIAMKAATMKNVAGIAETVRFPNVVQAARLIY
jgi:hypothetical protein